MFFSTKFSNYRVRIGRIRVIMMYCDRKRDMDTYLLIKYLRCSTTPEEEKMVRDWLAGDIDGSRAKQYSDAHFIYEGMLVHADSANTFVSGNRTHGFRKIAAVAASVAAAVLLAGGAGYLSRSYTLSELEAKTETIYVPAGKSMQMTLEDGTTIWMNSGTEVIYPSVFSRTSRDIQVLSGEVMLDVAKDEKRPFNVDTYASTISVLGTKFNVAVDEYAGGFSVALLRGSVKVSSKLQPSEIYTLKPNQMLSLDGDHFIMGYIDNPDAVSCWTDGLIDITGVAFDRLMRRFELAYDVNIVIDRLSMPEIRYTRGKVRVSDGIEHAMNMLALVSDFTYEFDRQSNTVIIR